MDEKTLYEKLKDYAENGRIPFHMPGHKRADRYPYLNDLGAHMDLTEIDGFDNLHDPSGILAEGMDLLSKLYRSRRSFYLINGSTGGLLAAVRCAVPFGGKVIMARNCHKAVYNAAELVGAHPVYIDPCRDETFGFCLDVAPQEVEDALSANPDAAAVIVTSPTYDGVVSDIGSIAKICHSRGIPLIVDEAHGAHLGYPDVDIVSAAFCGADIVIQSFHKTLPSLTQTAVAHICGDLVDPERYAAELAVFETSSPSYLLMASLDGCVRFLADPRERRMFIRRWEEIMDYAERRMVMLTGIRVFMGNAVPRRAIWGYDRSKFVIAADGMDGPTLAELLRQHNIEPEMVAAGYVLLMTGADTTKEWIDALIDALTDAAERGEKESESSVAAVLSSDPGRVMKMTPFQARGCVKEVVPLESVPVGAVSGDYVFAYPPGIPIVCPGEEITEGIKEALSEILRLGLNPATLHGAFKGEIFVIKGNFVGKTY